MNNLVKQYQQLLNKQLQALPSQHGASPLEVDGIIGKRTRALAALLGYDVSKHVDSLGRNLIPNMNLRTLPARGLSVEIDSGVLGNIVAVYQRWLNSQGATLKIDGVVGIRTESQAARLRRNLKADLVLIARGVQLQPLQSLSIVLSGAKKRKIDTFPIVSRYQQLLNQQSKGQRALKVDGLLGARTVGRAITLGRAPLSDLEVIAKQLTPKDSAIVEAAENSRALEAAGQSRSSGTLTPRPIPAAVRKRIEESSTEDTREPTPRGVNPMDPRYLSTATQAVTSPFSSDSLSKRVPLNHPARVKRDRNRAAQATFESIASEAGYNEASVRSLVKLVLHESAYSFDPRQLEMGVNFRLAGGRNRGGFGFIQWTNQKRVRGLQKIASRLGTTVLDARVQSLHLINELNDYGMTPRKLNRLSEIDTISLLVRRFTIPGNKAAAIRSTSRVRV